MLSTSILDVTLSCPIMYADPIFSTEKVDGMFATIVVILPSRFSGGAAHLSHAGKSKVFDCSPTSLLKTTVMAWYTDVTHEIKPITGGHRLALTYNLVHTTTSLRPALVQNSEFLERAKSILCSWNRDGGKRAPEKLLCVLEHQYSQANLRASALKGSDAQKVALLSQLADKLGFHLGLASITCHLRGVPENEQYCTDSDQYVSIYQRDSDVEKFVDMEGSLLANTLAYKKKVETIPEDLTKNVEDKMHYEQEQEKYYGNVGACVDSVNEIYTKH